MRDSRRVAERASNEDIIRHVRRFGPLTTRQVADALGIGSHSILSRLQSLKELQCEDKLQKKFWRVKCD